jgi:hypothetical protein
MLKFYKQEVNLPKNPGDMVLHGLVGPRLEIPQAGKENTSTTRWHLPLGGEDVIANAFRRKITKGTMYLKKRMWQMLPQLGLCPHPIMVK